MYGILKGGRAVDIEHKEYSVRCSRADGRVDIRKFPRCFRNWLFPHLHGVSGGLVEPKLMTRCPTLCCVYLRSAWALGGTRPPPWLFRGVKRSFCRSQWPHSLRHRSWVRIPPGAWMFVCCECCVLWGRGLCDELITRPEESYRLWCIVVWSRNLKNEEAMARVGQQRQWKKKKGGEVVLLGLESVLLVVESAAVNWLPAVVLDFMWSLPPCWRFWGVVEFL